MALQSKDLSNPGLLALHITPPGRRQKIHSAKEMEIRYFHFRLWKIMGFLFLASLAILRFL